MKFIDWVFRKKATLIVVGLGAVAGLLYWNFVGCVTGGCVITSNWHTAMIYGALVGWLIGDFINEKIINLKKNE